MATTGGIGLAKLSWATVKTYIGWTQMPTCLRKVTSSARPFFAVLKQTFNSVGGPLRTFGLSALQ